MTIGDLLDAPKMREHSQDVTWTFVVPPANTTRVCITQRQDGPFRADRVGGKGHYYVAMERLVHLSRWEHVPGSSHICALPSYEQAWIVAQEKWLSECRRSVGA